MLIATFAPSSGWAGRTITYEDGVFSLEGHGPVAGNDVLSYDYGEQLTWAHDGMRDWVEKAAVAERPRPKDDAPTVGLAGFVLSLLGFLFPFLWIVAIFMSRSALKEAKEKHIEPGLALWGFIISAVMIAIGVLLFVLYLALGATASLG